MRSQMVNTVSQQGSVVKRHMNQEVTYISGCTPRLSYSVIMLQVYMLRDYWFNARGCGESLLYKLQ